MYYSKLKEKCQKLYRQRSYDDILLSTLASQIAYEGYDENVNTNLLEIYKLLEGHAAIWHIKAADFLDIDEDKYVAAHITFSGNPTPDGLGIDCVVFDNAGHTKVLNDWKNNEDVVVIFNSNLMDAPDLSIGYFADMLNETDTSMLTLIKDAKHGQIPIVRDEKQKKALEQVMKDLDEGKHTAFVDDSILPPIVEGDDSERGVRTLDITDPSLADKIQYLAKCRDDIFRWFYSLNGMNSQGSSKLAQQTTDEVNQDSAASMIMPVIRLKEAQKGNDQCISKFGWNCAVSLSECWMNRKATLDEEFSETDEELDGGETETVEEEEVSEEKETVDEQKEEKEDGET